MARLQSRGASGPKRTSTSTPAIFQSPLLKASCSSEDHDPGTSIFESSRPASLSESCGTHDDRQVAVAWSEAAGTVAAVAATTCAGGRGGGGGGGGGGAGGQYAKYLSQFAFTHLCRAILSVLSVTPLL